MSDFHIKLGNLLPKIRQTLRDGAGSLINLTGATVQFRLRKDGATVAKFTAAAAVIGTASDGVVEYTWAGSDTDTLGDYDGEWVLDYAGKPMIVPSFGFVRVHVNPHL